jgi:hypothetical protein
LKAFESYEGSTMHWIKTQEENYAKLSNSHKALIPSFPVFIKKSSDFSILMSHLIQAKIASLKTCTKFNQKLMDQLISPHEIFDNSSQALYAEELRKRKAPTAHDMEKVKSTLRQLVFQ